MSKDNYIIFSSKKNVNLAYSQAQKKKKNQAPMCFFVYQFYAGAKIRKYNFTILRY